jgi:hypothetical protein
MKLGDHRLDIIAGELVSGMGNNVNGTCCYGIVDDPARSTVGYARKVSFEDPVTQTNGTCRYVGCVVKATLLAESLRHYECGGRVSTDVGVTSKLLIYYMVTIVVLKRVSISCST